MPFFSWTGRRNWFVWSADEPHPDWPTICVPVVDSHVPDGDFTSLCLYRLEPVEARGLVTRRAALVQCGASVVLGQCVALVPAIGYLDLEVSAAEGIFDSCPDLPRRLPCCVPVHTARRMVSQLRAMLAAAGRRTPVPPPPGTSETEHRCALETEAGLTVFVSWVLMQLAAVSHRAGGQWRDAVYPQCRPEGPEPCRALPRDRAEEKDRVARGQRIQQANTFVTSHVEAHGCSPDTMVVRNLSTNTVALCDAFRCGISRICTDVLVHVAASVTATQGTGLDDECERPQGTVEDPVGAHEAVCLATVAGHASLVTVIRAASAARRALANLRADGRVRLAPALRTCEWASLEKALLQAECTADLLEEVVLCALGTGSPQLCPGDRRRVCARFSRMMSEVVWDQALRPA